MELQFISIGGQNKNLNYQNFEFSIRRILGKTCKEATIVILNRFPIVVSSGMPLDFILVISIRDFEGNYFRLKKNDKWIYLNNLIIPVVMINNLDREELIKGLNNKITVNKKVIDYTEEVLSIKKNVKRYLVSRCNFNDATLFISPLIFIKNKLRHSSDNILISDSFTADSLIFYLQHNSQKTYFCSYKEWKADLGINYLAEKCKEIVAQASIDSELGFLTKKKIERITVQIARGNSILNQSDDLTIIYGNAGTGKSTKLISAMLNCLSLGSNSLFLTYNRLLVFDISTIIHGFLESKIDQNLLGDELGAPMVTSLHRYFKALSKSLGPLYILSEKRKGDILINLRDRMAIVTKWINLVLAEQSDINGTSLTILKNKIQNTIDFSIEIKEIGIDWVNFLIKENFSQRELNNTHAETFFNSKFNLLEKIGDDIFLQDYYNVLQEILNVIKSPEQYFYKNEIGKRYDLLQVVFNLPVNVICDQCKSELYCQDFVDIISSKIEGMRSTRVFVDEAQDCHHLEKEILLSIYGPGNLIVASGGREQLIRHPILCKWAVFNGRKINVKKVLSSAKSLRVKTSILTLCNYIAKAFRINLNLLELEADDPGEIIFDFRANTSSLEVKEIVGMLCLKSNILGCSALESVLIMIDSRSTNNQAKLKSGESCSCDVQGVSINENGNLEVTIAKKRFSWVHKNFLIDESNLLIWDGTVKDKSQLHIPFSTETRLIYYESCRGLEAWAVACYSIDSFYSRKKAEPDSEKFLNDDEKKFGVPDLYITSDERKKAFAATWILMAITRAVDTLYLNIEDENSELGRVLREFIETNPDNIRVYESSDILL